MRRPAALAVAALATVGLLVSASALWPRTDEGVAPSAPGSASSPVAPDRRTDRTSAAPTTKPEMGGEARRSAAGRARSMSSGGPVRSNSCTSRATASAGTIAPPARLPSTRSANSGPIDARNVPMRVATVGSAWNGL